MSNAASLHGIIDPDKKIRASIQNDRVKGRSESDPHASGLGLMGTGNDFGNMSRMGDREAGIVGTVRAAQRKRTIARAK